MLTTRRNGIGIQRTRDVVNSTMEDVAETITDSSQSLIVKADANIMKVADLSHQLHHSDRKEQKDPNNILLKKVVDCRTRLETVENNCEDTITTLNMEVVKSLHIPVVMAIQITLTLLKTAKDIVHVSKVSSTQ